MQDGLFAEVGRALKALRESAVLSQAELARKARVGKSQLSKYENGKELPKLETLARLLEVLGVEPLTLFYTAHLLRHRAKISPAALLMTTTPDLGDPALESFRRLFGHFLESFEVLMAACAVLSFHEPSGTIGIFSPSVPQPKASLAAFLEGEVLSDSRLRLVALAAPLTPVPLPAKPWRARRIEIRLARGSAMCSGSVIKPGFRPVHSSLPLSPGGAGA